MLKRLLSLSLSFFLLLAISSCSGNSNAGMEVQTGNQTLSGVDYNQYTNAPGWFALTPSVYVMTLDDQLWFLESSLEAPTTILCSDANCPHTDEETCGALLPFDTSSIFAWKDRLYYISCSLEKAEMNLYSMDKSGKNRKLEATLDVDVSSGSYGYTVRIASGHLVLTLMDSTTNGDATTLYLFPMEDPGAPPTVLFTNRTLVEAGELAQEEIPRASPMYLTEDWVFYEVEQGPLDEREYLLYGYRVSTGETKLLVAEDFFGGDDLSLVGESLYWFDMDGKLYQIDIPSGDIVLQGEIPLEEQEYGSCDDRWLYIVGGGVSDPASAELAIYDFIGHEVQRLSCSELGVPLSYAFSTEDRVFFRSSGRLGGSFAPICYLEKAEIAKGTAQIIPLDTP